MYNLFLYYYSEIKFKMAAQAQGYFDNMKFYQ